MKKVLAIGDIIWDVYPEGAVIGGSAFNFAAHISLLKQECYMLSAVGEDKLGEDACRKLAEFSVSDRFVQKNSHPTGQCLVRLDENKIPTFRLSDDAAFDYMKVDRAELDLLCGERFDAVYFGTVPQRNRISRTTVQNLVSSLGCCISFCDLNLRKNCYDYESVNFNLSHATVLKISDEEEPLCRELGIYRCRGNEHSDITRAIAGAFPNLKIILLTLGAEGAFAYETETGREYYQPAVKVKAVSTVGAGDSFSAAWLASYLDGKDIPACMEKAAQVSAFVVAHTDAVPKY